MTQVLIFVNIRCASAESDLRPLYRAVPQTVLVVISKCYIIYMHFSP